MRLSNHDDQEPLVFVYGTLRREECRFGVKSFLEVVHQEAYLPGFVLHNLGSFPGILPGPGRVRGEIHRYSGFKVLDSIEGFREKDPENSLYLRQYVEVEVSGDEPTSAWTYVFNLHVRSKSSLPPIIESGDWFEHRGLYRKHAHT